MLKCHLWPTWSSGVYQMLPAGCLHESQNQVLGIKAFITFDVWLTVRLNLVKVTKPTRCHLCSTLFLLINCSTCFGKFHAHHQELTTERCDRRAWYSAVAAGGCRSRLAGSMSMDILPASWLWQQLQHYTTHHHSVSCWWWPWNCPKHVEP